jgi:hypothetical protein
MHTALEETRRLPRVTWEPIIVRSNCKKIWINEETPILRKKTKIKRRWRHHGGDITPHRRYTTSHETNTKGNMEGEGMLTFDGMYGWEKYKREHKWHEILRRNNWLHPLLQTLQIPSTRSLHVYHKLTFKSYQNICKLRVVKNDQEYYEHR